MMNWEDVDDILFDGTEEEIDAVKCPECDGNLKFSYFPKTRNMETVCLDCGTVIRAHGAYKEPNFSLFAKNRLNRESTS